MAEESDLEKTEPASPRRLEKAREDGDVPRSRELTTCTMLLAAGAGLWFSGGSAIDAVSKILSSSLAFERMHAFDTDFLLATLPGKMIDVLLAFAPLAILLLIVALATPMLMGGWLFSGKALEPKPGRMNPLSGIKNMFSTQALVELGKAVGKSIIVGSVAWLVVSGQAESMMGLALVPVKTSSAVLADMLVITFFAVVAGLVLIAAIDVPYQQWRYAEKLKMSREELRRESKESDGNPEIKAKIRQQQREMARRRMMAEIPTADVVVTNPTHYAVALKYAEGRMGAPRVVAKGADAVAAKIREIASENGVPLLESPVLARALHAHTELGDEIPETLYTAVAQVLAYVFQLRAYRKEGGLQPNAPESLEVPEELDPHSPAFLSAKARRLQMKAAEVKV
jgi:flagellar biosynthetic protein FlhB